MSQYGYDLAGNQVLERTTDNGLIEQDSTISYDAQGRISAVEDPAYQLTYQYDAAGNRTHIAASYSDHTGYLSSGLQTQDLWYTYDAENRVLVSQGANVDGTVEITSDQGVALTYNGDGERSSATSDTGVLTDSGGLYAQGGGTEVYTYDGLGDLLTTTDNGILTDSRQYDGAQRETQDLSYVIDAKNDRQLDQQVQTTTYDSDGRAQVQLTTLNGLWQTEILYGEATYQPPSTEERLVTLGGNSSHYGTYGGDQFDEADKLEEINIPGGWTQGYDPAGNLRGYTVQLYDANGDYAYSDTYTVSYRQGEGYEQTEDDVSASTILRGETLPEAGSTSRTYDVDGYLTATTDSQKATNDRYFADDASGNALVAVQGNFDGKGSDLTVPQAFQDALARTSGNNVLAQYFFFANGQSVGSFGQLTDPNGNFTANFDVNFTPVSPTYPPSVPSSVVAQSGDTLRTIAARVFGDSTLWYLVAQENGLTDPGATIQEGTQLRIPNNVVSLHNTSSSFKPFDVSQALGNTTPTQPNPPPPQQHGGGCGVLGEILVAVVAIVVTVVTEGAAATALTGILGSFAPAAAGALGAVAGSVASQGVGLAIGQQNSFSWDEVASAAIGGAVGGGLVGAEGQAADTVGAEIANAAIDSAASQEANIALGLQKGFNWAAVAASAIAAPLAKAAGKEIEGPNPSAATEGEQLASQLAQGAINETAYAVFTGGKINYAQIAADGFGNAIGEELTGAGAVMIPVRVLPVDDGLIRGRPRGFFAPTVIECYAAQWSKGHGHANPGRSRAGGPRGPGQR